MRSCGPHQRGEKEPTERASARKKPTPPVSEVGFLEADGRLLPDDVSGRSTGLHPAAGHLLNLLAIEQNRNRNL